MGHSPFGGITGSMSMSQELICYTDLQTDVLKEGASGIHFQKSPPKIEQERARFLITFTAQNTRMTYNRALTKFIAFWSLHGFEIESASEVQRTHIDTWKQDLTEKFPPSSVGSNLAAVLSFFKFAFESEWMAKDITKGVKLPRVQKSKALTEALSEEELKRILSNLQEEFDALESKIVTNAVFKKTWNQYCIFMTLCSVGMRVSELVNIRMTDLELTGKYPRLNLKLKGGELHAPLISDDLAEILRRYVMFFRKRSTWDEPLFTLSPQSKAPLSRKYVARLIDDIAEKSNVTKKISPHSCRATVASLLHKQCVPIGEIQDLLGHRSILTTMRYIKKIDEEKQSAARKNPLFSLTKG